jgi:prepilin-type processing-associated H-X9-DG protein
VTFAEYGTGTEGVPALVGRHTGLINCSFCDGHAKALASSQIANLKGPHNYPKYLTVSGG